jgi:hypothetical protein
MSLVARVIRQFHEGREAVTLARLVALPHMPTMGTRLDLRAQGVEAPLEVVAVTLRAHGDGPGLLQADADVFTRPEPLADATLAREGGRRDSQTA